MRCTILMPARRRLAGGLAVGAMVLGSAGLVGTATHAATGQTAPAAKTPTWITMQGKVAHLTLIAAWNNANAGFNFDGAAHGQMMVTVPLGTKVIASFKNDAQGAMHDAVIIPYTLPLPGHGTRPAFSGAASPTPRFSPGGPPTSAGTAQSFSFTASKAGTYMIICGIAGHALAGMWDTFIVSKTARTASVRFTKARVAGTTRTTTPPARARTWVSTAGNTVHLTLIAGWNNANAGFNFDGGANGQMTVTVPLGDRIIGTFRNAASTPHDVRIIHYQKPLPSHTVALAFPGASAGGPTGGFGRRGTPGPGGGGPPPGTPGPGPGGAPPSNKPQTFSFVASKAGTYMIICGFPGHALAGMWDTFVVSPTAKAASITFK